MTSGIGSRTAVPVSRVVETIGIVLISVAVLAMIGSAVTAVVTMGDSEVVVIVGAMGALALGTTGVGVLAAGLQARDRAGRLSNAP